MVNTGRMNGITKNDPSDRRCAFTGYGCEDGALAPGDENWCWGCQFYICEGCYRNYDMPFGGHDVTEHQIDPEDEYETADPDEYDDE